MANTKQTATKRVFFTKGDAALPLPNLIAHQKDSWRDFVETGLGEIFAELNPIDDYTGQKLELRFGKYEFQDPKNSEKYAKENNLTFDAPLHATVELTNKVTGEVKEQEIYLGDYPWMTDRGTFIINGTERVVVSMTTTTSRIENAARTIERLRRQSRQPDSVYLNVPLYCKRERRQYELPAELIALPNLIIQRSDDWGPATKLIPTLEVENNPDTIIITLDDDVHYKTTLIETLVEHALRWP